MSATETRTFRAPDLETVLGTVRSELGPDAIVVRQREGIVGGIGGFFGTRCVEVDVECPPATRRQPKPQPSAVPPRAVSAAYAAQSSAIEDLFGVEEDGDDGGELFRSLIGDHSVFASTLTDVMVDASAEAERAEPPAAIVMPEVRTSGFGDDEPGFEPLAELAPVTAVPVAATPPAGESHSTELLPASAGPTSVALMLQQAGMELELVDSIISEAHAQLRVFDPVEPFGNQVREVLAGRISTRRLTGRQRRRVVALVGAPGTGRTSVAARMCAAHVSAGKNVVALSLEPVRQTIELARRTDGLDVELISADQLGLIDFALARLAKADVVIVDTPGVASSDQAGWARLGLLLGALGLSETHLIVPATENAAAIDAQLSSATEATRIDRLLITHLGGDSSPAAAVSASLRSGIPISATASNSRLMPADPYRLAAQILP